MIADIRARLEENIPRRSTLACSRLNKTSAKLSQRRWDSELLIIQKALQKARGNREAAARVLGISRSSLWRKMKAYDLL